MDLELSLLYGVMISLNNLEDVKRDQEVWQEWRNKCMSTECVNNAYLTRLGELEEVEKSLLSLDYFRKDSLVSAQKVIEN
ncbi:hypothetical protein AR456_18365 [Halomonas huangheensis]|nr:hypothetical protein AR456_18365 [Halomonas huangheensis]